MRSLGRRRCWDCRCRGRYTHTANMGRWSHRRRIQCRKFDSTCRSTHRRKSCRSQEGWGRRNLSDRCTGTLSRNRNNVGQAKPKKLTHAAAPSVVCHSHAALGEGRGAERDQQNRGQKGQPAAECARHLLLCSQTRSWGERSGVISAMEGQQQPCEPISRGMGAQSTAQLERLRGGSLQALRHPARAHATVSNQDLMGSHRNSATSRGVADRG